MLVKLEWFNPTGSIIKSDGGGVTKELVNRLIYRAREFAAAPGAYRTDQLNNSDSLVGYRAIGRELLELDRPIDVFCASVGTAGLSMGVASALREGGSEARIVIFEPASTPVISGGEPGSRSVEGIGIGFVPPLLDAALYDEVRAIDEADARVMARRLAKEEGLLAGTSPGLNVAGAIGAAQEVGTGGTVVTVACDTGLKYLAGDLYGG